MKDIIERNYQSIRKRGLITDKTNPYDFIHKLDEETDELEYELYYNGPKDEKTAFELEDVILTALNFARHYDIDIESYLLKKIEINEKR
jgi:uncharacterized protein YabN with tetrapyrrole methylase and pyrophosphatase domain